VSLRRWRRWWNLLGLGILCLLSASEFIGIGIPVSAYTCLLPSTLEPRTAPRTAPTPPAHAPGPAAPHLDAHRTDGRPNHCRHSFRLSHLTIKKANVASALSSSPLTAQLTYRQSWTPGPHQGRRCQSFIPEERSDATGDGPDGEGDARGGEGPSPVTLPDTQTNHELHPARSPSTPPPPSPQDRFLSLAHLPTAFKPLSAATAAAFCSRLRDSPRTCSRTLPP
jgi:hypothetical protein